MLYWTMTTVYYLDLQIGYTSILVYKWDFGFQIGETFLSLFNKPNEYPKQYFF